MVFSSPIFLFAFLPACILVYFLISIFGNIKLKNLCLLIFSIIFYAYGSIEFLPILLTSIVINYILALTFDNEKTIKYRKLFFIFSIIYNVGLLFIFKYLNLFSGVFLGAKNATNIILPIGISFYTFQVISYQVDVYKGSIKACDYIIDFALFVMLFSQLIAGPIVRYNIIEGTLKKRHVTIDLVASGILRFMVGFSKKILFANSMGKIADIAFNNLGYYDMGFILSLFSIVCYSIQIYLDFWAYSDMAIGIGKIFGFTFPENFDTPFTSKSISEFWRRWHITLSSFFSDYVYKPLGGSRKGLFRTCLNLTIVFALSGFWHGANFNYLAWGLYNALFLIIERIITTKTNFKFNSRFGIIYVYIVWIFGMIIFRCEGTSTFMQFFKGLCSETALNYYSRSLIDAIINPYFVLCLIISILYLTPFFDTINTALKKSNIGSIVVDLFVIVLFIYAVMEMLTVGFNPFIYFRF